MPEHNHPNPADVAHLDRLVGLFTQHSSREERLNFARGLAEQYVTFCNQGQRAAAKAIAGQAAHFDALTMCYFCQQVASQVPLATISIELVVLTNRVLDAVEAKKIVHAARQVGKTGTVTTNLTITADEAKAFAESLQPIVAPAEQAAQLQSIFGPPSTESVAQSEEDRELVEALFDEAQAAEDFEHLQLQDLDGDNQ